MLGINATRHLFTDKSGIYGLYTDEVKHYLIEAAKKAVANQKSN